MTGDVDIGYIGADMVLRVLGVVDQDGAAQGNATVVVDAIEQAGGDGTDLLGAPVSGTLVSGSTNDYVVPFPPTLALIKGAFYRAEGSITIASGKVLPFRHQFRATHFTTPK